MSEVDNSQNNEEISLRDVYLILRAKARLILGFTLIPALLALVVSLVLPKVYSSRAVFSVTLSQDRPEFKSAPTPPGITQGFAEVIRNDGLRKELSEPDTKIQDFYQSKFDERKNIWTLTAMGNTPEQAQARAQKLAEVARDYAITQVGGTIRSNYEATMAQNTVDLGVAENTLKRLLAEQPNIGAPNNDPNVAAGLEATRVNPQAARSSNPALVSVSLQMAQLRATRAQLQSQIASIKSLLNDNNEFKLLVGRGMQVQVLADPTAPLEADFPRPFLYTALAAVLGLLIGLVAAFVSEALRDPNAVNAPKTPQNVVVRGRQPQSGQPQSGD
jgi:LPS O-antigen subunit length determinant protein (WzzB/FepE family)